MQKKSFPLILLSCILLTSCTPDFPFNFGDDEPLLSPKRFLNVAHRGASGHAPEHTMPAYELGKEMNGDYFEIDLQLTKDGHIVAMHDDYIDRVSEYSGKVDSYTLEELKQIDIGSWFNRKYPQRAKDEYKNQNVLTLEEIIDEFGTDINYYIEIKKSKDSDKIIEKLLNVLEEYDLIPKRKNSGQVVIQSFYPEYLLEIHELEPNIPLVQLIRYRKRATISKEKLETIQKYAVGIGLNHRRLSKRYVRKVREAGLLIHPYTVNKKSRMKKLIRWGVTGIFTDFPDRLDDVLKELKVEE